MKRFTYFLWVLSLPALVNTQEDFAPVGAEWYYGMDVHYSSGSGYQHFIVEKDTTYLDKLCKKVIVTRYGPYGNINGKFNFFTYNQDDSVYYSYHENFYLLYDFGLEIGDTIKVRVPSDYYKPEEYEDTLLIQTVSSIETVIIEGLSSKRIYFNHPDYTDYFGPYYEYYTEKLGGSHYFFPYEWEYAVELIEPIFRCYTDSVIQYKLVSTCDALRPPEYINNYGSVINKIWISDNYLNISINSDKIISPNLRITFIDISGRIIYVTDIDYNSDIYSINVNEISKGMYFITIDTGTFNIPYKIIIP